MSVQFNPFPDPKRGKARAAMKRPAAAKDKEWSSVPYVRGAEDEAEPARADQCKWSRSISELLTSTTSDLVEILREDGLLPSRKTKSVLDVKMAHCHRCGSTLRSLMRCPNTGAIGGVVRSTSIRTTCTQSLWKGAALQLLLNNVPHPVIHRLLHANHKSIEDMSRRLRDARTGYVEEKEKSIVLGGEKNWVDIEADETSFAKKIVAELVEDKSKPVLYAALSRGASQKRWC